MPPKPASTAQKAPVSTAGKAPAKSTEGAKAAKKCVNDFACLFFIFLTNSNAFSQDRKEGGPRVWRRQEEAQALA